MPAYSFRSSWRLLRLTAILCAIVLVLSGLRLQLSSNFVPVRRDALRRLRRTGYISENATFPLLNFRRSQVTTLSADGNLLLNIGGVGKPDTALVGNIESFDFATGERAILASSPLLIGLNHHAAPPIYEEGDIEIVQGIRGSHLDSGNELRKVLRIMIGDHTANISESTEITTPRGGGATVFLRDLVINGQHYESLVCSFGGGVGGHISGTVSTASDCFCTKTGTWLSLPQLPVPMDHQGGLYVDEEACGYEEGCIIMMGGRGHLDLPETTDIWALVLSREHGTLGKLEWRSVGALSQCKSSFVSLQLSPEYILNVGGSAGQCGGIPTLDHIEVCLMEAHPLRVRCRRLRMRLKTGRLAFGSVLRQRYPRDPDGVLVACGGGYVGPNDFGTMPVSLGDCELIQTSDIWEEIDSLVM